MPFESDPTHLDPPPKTSRTLLLPVLLVAALIVALAAAVILRDFETRRQVAAAQLRAVADLRRLQVETWLRERLSLAGFLSTSAVFANQYLAWDERQDTEALQTLMARMTALRRANGSDEVLLLDAMGGLVARENPNQRELPEMLRSAALRAMASGDVVHTGIYRRDGVEPAVRLDIVLPLVGTGKPARAALVLRQNPRRELFPLLTAWPVPSDSGESLLWDQQGETLLAISDFRFAADAAARLTRSINDHEPVAAAVLRNASPNAAPVLARDYRGESVLATARPIAGTTWLLLTKMDRREIDGPAWTTARWATSLALLALLALAAGARLFVQRAALRGSEREREEHRRRLQTLMLLQAITDNSGDAIFAKDREGRYVFFNRAAAEALGLRVDDVIGRTDAELFPPDVAAALRRNDTQAMAVARKIEFEETFDTPHGPFLNLSTKGPLRDTDGSVVGIFGVARNITESRRAERALRDGAMRLRSVFDVLDEGILVRDRAGNVLSANPAAARLLLQPDRPVTGGIGDVGGWVPLGPDGVPLAAPQTPIGRALASGQAQRNRELQMRGPGGQPRWFSVSVQPVRESDMGAIDTLVVSFSDITERRLLAEELERHRHHLQELVDERTQALQQANAQLADAERFLRLVADNLPVRIVYWDRDLTCRFGNRNYFEWYGLTPEQAIGRSARAIHGEAHFQRYGNDLLAAMAGTGCVLERETQRADGSVWHHQIHYVPDRGGDGSVQGVYAAALDITPIKVAQSRLRLLNGELEQARDRAEDANRAKSAFLANMSHEIRTPMNAIIGLAHLMSRDTTEAVQRDRLDKIGSSAHHLLQIINDILDLSKIEAGRLALEDVGFSLDAVLARTFEMVSNDAHRKGLELIVDTDHIPDALRGDPTRLSQALLNLLANAVKFTESGWVRLVAEKLADDGDRIQMRFSVSDTGVGIAADRLGALFTAFEQVDSSISRRHGGTGLGLALTRRLATMMGGEAGAESAPGVGSRFWFTAWLGRGSASTAEGAVPALTDRRALLVDDLAEARAALGDRLRQFGLRVDAVESGERALSLAQAAIEADAVYDLLLIDWRMEPLDGIQTLERLRALLGDGLPPAVLVTAHDDDAMRHEAQRARFAAVLVKPITASSLHDTLVRVLRQESPPQAGLLPPPPGTAELALRLAATGLRVLLAEDNPVNQEVALELLRATGLQVDVADDGRQAVTMALAAPYAAILMDVQMPALDGMEATRELRRRGVAAPIVAMTANAFGEDRAACLAAGMNDHVAKPVDPEVLYATLLRWLPRNDGAMPAPAPSAAAPADLLARCALIDGFDAALALRSAGGRVEVLERLLRRFAEHYADGLAPLVRPGDDDRLAGWGLAAHSLQGACGAIGAAALQAQARAFEAGVREATSAAPLQQPAAALHAALQAFVAALQRTLQ